MELMLMRAVDLTLRVKQNADLGNKAGWLKSPCLLFIFVLGRVSLVPGFSHCLLYMTPPSSAHYLQSCPLMSVIGLWMPPTLWYLTIPMLHTSRVRLPLPYDLFPSRLPDQPLILPSSYDSKSYCHPDQHTLLKMALSVLSLLFLAHSHDSQRHCLFMKFSVRRVWDSGLGAVNTRVQGRGPASQNHIV